MHCYSYCVLLLSSFIYNFRFYFRLQFFFSCFVLLQIFLFCFLLFSRNRFPWFSLSNFGVCLFHLAFDHSFFFSWHKSVGWSAYILHIKKYPSRNDIAWHEIWFIFCEWFSNGRIIMDFIFRCWNLFRILLFSFPSKITENFSSLSVACFSFHCRHLTKNNLRSRTHAHTNKWILFSSGPEIQFVPFQVIDFRYQYVKNVVT